MAGALTISTLNDSSGVLATQNGMSGICKAWVNFNGLTTTTIRGSFNVSSVTRNSAGDTTINFTTAMPDVNYSAVATCGLFPGTGSSYAYIAFEYCNSGNTLYRTASAYRVITTGNSTSDSVTVNVVFNR